MKTVVFVKAQFEGFHRWANAPDDVAFLQNYHRHIFFAELGVEVTHADRDVEFFQLKRKVEAFLSKMYKGQQFEKSCEMVAAEIAGQFQEQGYNVSYVTVSEDNENGATITL